MKDKLLLALKLILSKDFVTELGAAFQEGVKINGQRSRQLLAEIDAEADRLAAERASQQTTGEAEQTT